MISDREGNQEVWEPPERAFWVRWGGSVKSKGVAASKGPGTKPPKCDCGLSVCPLMAKRRVAEAGQRQTQEGGE